MTEEQKPKLPELRIDNVGTVATVAPDGEVRISGGPGKNVRFSKSEFVKLRQFVGGVYADMAKRRTDG